jgi:hypothetical protein
VLLPFVHLLACAAPLAFSALFLYRSSYQSAADRRSVTLHWPRVYIWLENQVFLAVPRIAQLLSDVNCCQLFGRALLLLIVRPCPYIPVQHFIDKFGRTPVKLPESISIRHVPPSSHLNEWSGLYTMVLRVYSLSCLAKLAATPRSHILLSEIFPSLATADAQLFPLDDLLPILRSDHQLTAASMADCIALGRVCAIMTAAFASSADSWLLLRLREGHPNFCHRLLARGAAVVTKPKHPDWLAILIQSKQHLTPAQQNRAVDDLRAEYTKCSQVASICPFLMVVLSDATTATSFTAPNLLFLGKKQLPQVYGPPLMDARREEYLSPLPPGFSLRPVHDPAWLASQPVAVKAVAAAWRCSVSGTSMPHLAPFSSRLCPPARLSACSP